jgi:predicted nucleotidyltransferase
MLNNDYKDMLSALSEANVEYILVGAYAIAAHGYPRATMDIDFWVKPSKENAQAVMRALARFGAPLHEVSATDFETAGVVFQIGVEPRRIDILTAIDGVDFDSAFAHSGLVEIEGISVRVLSIPDLITNKRSAGRKKDLLDAAMLEEKQNASAT